jgi:hypothetical protein
MRERYVGFAETTLAKAVPARMKCGIPFSALSGRRFRGIAQDPRHPRYELNDRHSATEIGGGFRKAFAISEPILEGDVLFFVGDGGSPKLV